MRRAAKKLVDAEAAKKNLMAEPRRFPPPWFVEETAPCFIVRDHNGLAFVYCEDEPGRRTAANLLTADEARRIAANIVKLRALDLLRMLIFARWLVSKFALVDGDWCNCPASVDKN
jgi:hypothetical protein